jgi:phthalate 4,5-dioxygenase
MLSPADNDRLCRVENAAPMGAMMRKHWLPVCLVEEVAEPDGTPVRARVLGEDLVVFRDTAGRVGVMDEQCPHRRASLALGRNEQGGLRCLYHGWKMDVLGNVLEMVSEPNASAMCEKVKHLAYPTQEWAGVVWAYLGARIGAPEPPPAFAPPQWAPNAQVRVSIAKVIVPCNWAQVLEGAIDSAHSSSLHSSDMVPAPISSAGATDKLWTRPSADKAPRLQMQRTQYGFRYAAIRQPILNADTHDYVRSSVFVAPCTVLIPPNNLYNVANVNVPIDDTHTAFYFIAWGHPETTPTTAAWRAFLGQAPGKDLDAEYRPLRNIENRFWQDRDAMKAGNFTGIVGFPNQDLAMWLTMGPIADRSREWLGSSDLAVVQFRRIMLDALKKFEQTGAAIGAADSRVPANVHAFQAMVPKTHDWRGATESFVWNASTSSVEEQSYVVPKSV